jgi:hypothetical protein
MLLQEGNDHDATKSNPGEKLSMRSKASSANANAIAKNADAKNANINNAHLLHRASYYN